MVIEVGEKRKVGRKPRYGVKLAPALPVSFPPAMLELIREKAGRLQSAEPEEDWSASRFVVEELAEKLRFDLSTPEPQ